ncbi:ABC transporter ATP-binding protein [Pollutimonas harenae]|uniref:ATP-binding cassette domain-containing protein n=1 Tax=Pollutimonas harenae TaxID=657015 RepID=A0A853GXZ6_9BURK|nr:ATP-binding cassette domain-containing protein [Pollutimonas harenae]NYT85616.1 ATP-binding cassette domain-containing protein [Pollutimonas harenae]TEA70694.1 ATP-binding cassette domain-containing protein [Pollutimonas harenae]
MLKLTGVNVDLAGNRILRDIHCNFVAGSTVGIVGRNGAGKTTLLRSIMGLVKLRSGEIMLDDVNLAALPGHARAGLQIGYSPEDRVIFPTMSVEENLRLPCASLKQSRQAIDQRLEVVIEAVPDLKPLLKRSGSALSGGQGKMVALGRALMVGTRLLLLDEPYQGLAPKLGLIYTQALGRLKTMQPDLCVVITESNIKLLGDIPDRIWSIERGSIELQKTL